MTLDEVRLESDACPAVFAEPSPAVARTPMPFLRYPGSEVEARNTVTAAFAGGRVLKLRLAQYRIDLHAIGAAFEAPSEPALSACIEVNGEPVELTFPAQLAWQWLNDITPVARRSSRSPSTAGEAEPAQPHLSSLPLPAGLPLPASLSGLLAASASRFLMRLLIGQQQRLALLPGLALRMPRIGMTAEGDRQRAPDNNPASGKATRQERCTVTLRVRYRPISEGPPMGRKAEADRYDLPRGQGPHVKPKDGPTTVMIELTSAKHPAGPPAACLLGKLIAMACNAALPSIRHPIPFESAHVRAIHFHCPLVGAQLTLPYDALQALRIGDVLLPETVVHQDGRGAVLILPTQQRLSVTAGPLRQHDASPAGFPCDDPRFESRFESGMRHITPVPAFRLKGREASANTLEPCAGAGVRIDIEIARARLSIDTLIRLATLATGRNPGMARTDGPGQIGESARSNEAWGVPVRMTSALKLRIRANGITMGLGEVIRVGGQIGIRLTRWERETRRVA